MTGNCAIFFMARNSACSGIPGNMAAIHSKETNRRNQTNENRTTSGLPGTSAVIRCSSWKFSRQFLSVTFCQHMLLALLFTEDYFRSLLHTTFYIVEARNPIFASQPDFDVYYLPNFHLQCWFLSPANCLQTHFRIQQISTRSKGPQNLASRTKCYLNTHMKHNLADQ